MGDSYRTRLLDVACEYRTVVAFFLALNLVFLALSLFALPFVDPGSGSSFILGVNFAIVLTVVAITSTLLYVCRTRDDDGGEPLPTQQ